MHTNMMMDSDQISIQLCAAHTAAGTALNCSRLSLTPDLVEAAVRGACAIAV